MPPRKVCFKNAKDLKMSTMEGNDWAEVVVGTTTSNRAAVPRHLAIRENWEVLIRASLAALFVRFSSAPTPIPSIRPVSGALLGGLAAMILQEFLIDRLASPEALFGAVPEADLVLAQLPAQAHVAILIARHEVEQADIQVLH